MCGIVELFSRVQAQQPSPDGFGALMPLAGHRQGASSSGCTEFVSAEKRTEPRCRSKAGATNLRDIDNFAGEG